MIAAETTYAQADDGVHIAYQAFGVGAYDILFVPGQISHLDVAWREPAYVRWIERLVRLGRVILIDRRGVGLSDRLSPADLPPAEVLAEDLGVVLEAAGATKPILFGFAEGGQICSLFAAMHPKRIEALVTYGMWTHVRDEDRPEWERSGGSIGRHPDGEPTSTRSPTCERSSRARQEMGLSWPWWERWPGRA